MLVGLKLLLFYRKCCVPGCVVWLRCQPSADPLKSSTEFQSQRCGPALQELDTPGSYLWDHPFCCSAVSFERMTSEPVEGRAVVSGLSDRAFFIRIVRVGWD